MKKTAAVLLALMLCICSIAEPAVSVDGIQISAGEVKALSWAAGETYRAIAQYYRDYLDIDFWSLTYPNGQTVEDCIASDVFRQLVITGALCGMAEAEGIFLSESDLINCRAEALSWYETLDDPDFSSDDVTFLYEKQLLARRICAMLINDVELDTETDDTDEALFAAKLAVFEEQFDTIFDSAVYTIHDSFRGTIKLR